MYTREFRRLKIFVPSLVDIDKKKMTEKFIMGLDLELDLEISWIVEAIDVKSYEEPLRTVKVIEKHKDEVCWEPTIIVWGKRPYELRHSVRRPPAHRPRYENYNDPKFST